MSPVEADFLNSTLFTMGFNKHWYNYGCDKHIHYK